jgi:uncharacterized alkaline shock family protein YloU
MRAEDRQRLPCGADLAELTREVFDGAPPVDPEHQRECRHCRRALRRIRVVADDVRGVAATPVAVPGTLLDSVMVRIRSRPTLITIEVTGLGLTTVADHVVGEVAREAALRVAGVRHAAVIASEAAVGAVGIRARLVVSYGPTMPPLAERVRGAIEHSLSGRVGVRTESVDVLIDDLA